MVVEAAYMTPAASGLRQISLADLRHLAIEATPITFRGTPFNLLDFLDIG
jgi:hypothetical protein